MNEEKLLKGIRKKKERYLEEAMQQYGRLVYTLAAGLVEGDHHAAEEIVSDVFVELWKNADRIDLKKGSLKNMLCLIARSRALNYRKKEKRHREREEYKEELALYTEGVEEGVIEQENVRELIAAIRKVKEPASTILIMRYFQQESIEAIARKMGMKRSQVDNYLSRGRKKLGGLLEKAI